MALTNIINVTFGPTNVALVCIDWAYNYNAGILLKPVNLDLPATYQVHWALSADSTTSYETIGTEDGAPIPDEMWASGSSFYGWIYLHPTDDSSVTRYEIKVIQRKRAPLPTGTPTPAQQSVIDQAIAALNNAVEQTASDVATATAQAQAALDSAVDAEESAERAEQAATTAGFMEFEMVNGRIIYTKTDAVDADFSLVNGRLIMEAL